MRNKLKIALLAALFTVSTAANSIAIADDKPIELAANTIEYNAQTDTAIASGGVTVKRDGGLLTGMEATYDFKTQQVTITGGVTVNKDDMSLRADSLVSTLNKDLTATGDVVATKADNILTGPELQYNQVDNTIYMPHGGTADGPQAAMRGDVIEGNLNTKQYTATGDVYLNSKTNDIQSTSNKATYVGDGQNFNFEATGDVTIHSPSRNVTSHSDNATYSSADNGKLVLSGNAVATQNNNIVRGNTVTVYLGDNLNMSGSN